ncbi:MAG: hypothetical protein ACXVRU_14160 [Gaiellaceae bacterium]
MTARLDLHQDALQRYRDAQARAKLASDEWEKAGRPLILEHANRVVGLHPLLRVLEVAEAHTDKLRAAVRAEERGTWRVPVPRPGRSEPMMERFPASELRAIRGGRE